MRNILNELLLDPTKEEELEVFLVSYFKTGKGGKDNQMIYGNLLTIEYAKDKKKISAIYLDSKGDLNKLKADVEEAIYRSHGSKVVGVYILGTLKVNGYFKFRDDFQILPVSTTAPQPPYSFGEHPCLLEYKIARSSNSSVEIFRSEKMQWKIVNILSSLLKSGFTLKYIDTSNVWITRMKNDGTQTNEYLIPGYNWTPDERPLALDGFKSVQGINPLPIQNANDYYEAWQDAIDYDEGLIIPANLTESLIMYTELNFEGKEIYLRSCYWSQTARKLTRISSSSAFVALVTSIEALLPSSKKPKETPWTSLIKTILLFLGQDKPEVGPTKEFRDFIEKHATFVPKKLRKKLYGTRSDLAHGQILLMNDLGVPLSTSPNRFDQSFDLGTLFHLARLLQLQWLYARNLK